MVCSDGNNKLASTNNLLNFFLFKLPQSMWVSSILKVWESQLATLILPPWPKNTVTILSYSKRATYLNINNIRIYDQSRNKICAKDTSSPKK